jgi:hypothetical protein
LTNTNTRTEKFLLTRGYLIGQIVDDLSDIASQARQRARLGFTDLHIYVENFVKEVLNRAYGLSLCNPNEEQVNAPGIDLADDTNGWAFQVTGNKSLEKVKSTLLAITPEDQGKYGEIRILVVGDRQKSYSLEGEPYASFGFTDDMIWDFNDICKRVVGMTIEDLAALHNYVSLETQRVKIQLEVFEALPRPQLSDGAAMTEFLTARDYLIDPEQVEKFLTELSQRLSTLPRLTREVFKHLVERRDQMTAGSYDDFRISQPMIDRIYRGNDIEGDLALLKEAGLADPNEAEEHFGANYWRFTFPGRHYGFHQVLIDYMQDRKIDMQKVFVVLDFSDF